jgi:hypothetical protein
VSPEIRLTHARPKEQNCGPANKFPKRFIHLDKYRLRQYLVDKPDPELRRILHLVRHYNRQFRDSEGMDEKSIAFYLNRKGWTARLIPDDLVSILDEEAIPCSNVRKYLRDQIIRGNFTLHR